MPPRARSGRPRRRTRARERGRSRLAARPSLRRRGAVAPGAAGLRPAGRRALPAAQDAARAEPRTALAAAAGAGVAPARCRRAAPRVRRAGARGGRRRWSWSRPCWRPRARHPEHVARGLAGLWIAARLSGRLEPGASRREELGRALVWTLPGAALSGLLGLVQALGLYQPFGFARDSTVAHARFEVIGFAGNAGDSRRVAGAALPRRPGAARPAAALAGRSRPRSARSGCSRRRR